MRSLQAVAILLIAAGGAIGAQSTDTFEVVSLKPSRAGTRLTSTLDAAQFRCTAHTLMHLLMSAYPDIEVQPWKVSGGPAWLNNDTWDLSAKLPPNMPIEQEPLYRRTEQMLRNFLTEDFKLETHRETKEFPIYALVVARNGSKLKPSAATQFNVKFGRGRLEFRHQSLSGLAEYLYTYNAPVQQAADRPVIDRTGLQGFFDFFLEWTPDTPQPDPTASGPSIYTAIEQQLGLKLQPEKSPVEFLVIDHAERPAVN
jgi:bla regulator protein BlaR1